MAKTNHPVEPEELMAYLDGELPPGRAVSTAAHLEGCPECQRLAGDLQGVSHKLLAWEDVVSGAWCDPEFLKPFESQAEAVTVQENGRKSVTLKAIPAETKR